MQGLLTWHSSEGWVLEGSISFRTRDVEFKGPELEVSCQHVCSYWLETAPCECSDEILMRSNIGGGLNCDSGSMVQRPSTLRLS